MEQVKNSEKTQKKTLIKKGTRRCIVLAFLLISVIIAYVIYRGNYLETLELGEEYINIFWQNLTYKLATFGINFIFLFFLIYITNKRIKKGLTAFFEEEKKQMPKMLNKSIAFIASIIISFFVTNIIVEKFMLCINATNFASTDPIFGYDISYFIFVQPFIQLMLKYLIAIVVGLTVYATLYYIIAFNMYFDGIDREILKENVLIKQLCNNIMIIAILIALTIFMETFNVGLQKFLNLQGTNTYGIWGAGLSEVTIKLWGYRILSIIIVVTIALAIHYFKKKNTKRVITSLAVVPCYLMLMLILLAGFEFFIVSPNELDREQKYIEANINYTKQAYGINIEEVNLLENETITQADLEQNATVIENLVLTNKDIVLKNLNTLQTNKGYYTYRTAQLANYNINGKQSLVYVSPREIASSSGTYNNKTYEYTHGYGLIITSATSVDDKGNLVHLQKGFTKTNEDVANINEPRIYFGLETNNTVVTNSNKKTEFDYPIENSNKAENAENEYSGLGGLKLGFLDRLILSIKENNFKLAFSSSESKILINRNIIERAKALMPYIMYDENPYLVVTKEGRLVWVLDGYTYTDAYPFSQRILLQSNKLLGRTDINYIRNSVKVLIDAYDGTIKYYITDRNDPIIMAYQKIYKDLFVEKDTQIPQDISSQFIYPEFLYNIQAEIMERYHNIQTDVLYRGDDIWEVAKHNTGNVSNKVGTEIQPYYTMLKLQNDNKTTFGLVLPYTQHQKQSITSYLVGTSQNGEQKLTLYKYPSDSNILGPMQIDTQLEQDERISKEIENINVTGTRLIKSMTVVPINNSLLYVEPIYQQYINEDVSTPILKKIVVASGNKVAIGDNIKEALNNLVSQYAVDIEIEDTDDVNGLMETIIKVNNELKKSSENSNWEMIGKDMARLQELITKLETLLKEENENKENTNNQNINEQNVINSIFNNVLQ